MIFSGAGLTLYFNRSTFGVERLAVQGDSEALSWVYGKSFGLPAGNNFLINSDFSSGRLSGDFLYFSGIVCTLNVEEREGAIVFTYLFKNDTEKPVTVEEGELGICASFFDRHDEWELSLRRRVHAHIRTQGASYIYCERYSGAQPAIGLIQTKGETCSYSIERGLHSGERGETVLRLPEMTIAPKESYLCEFLLFACEGRNDFMEKSEKYGMLIVDSSDLTVYEGETVEFRSSRAMCLRTEDGEEIPFAQGVAYISAKGLGEHTVTIISEMSKVRATYFVLPQEILRKRIDFVMLRQILREGAYRGAFTAYDTRNDEVIFKKGGRSPFGLGGSTTAPLLLFLREGQKGDLSDASKEMLDAAVALYDREICLGGDECGEIAGKPARIGKKRPYYPLYALIKYEEYRATGDLATLVESAVILSDYYKCERICEAVPAEEIVTALRTEGKDAIADEIAETLLVAADRILDDALNKEHFAPKMVCGALSTLLDAYLLSREEKYLAKVQELLPVLSTFSFSSLSYATDDVPEIFTSDLGNGLTCDMAPHYTAIYFTLVYDKLYRATEQVKYREISLRIARACLTLFDDHGVSRRGKRASTFVNDLELSPYEEISCGEDIVLYYFDLLFGCK